MNSTGLTKRLLLLSYIVMSSYFGITQTFNFFYPPANDALPQQFVYALNRDAEGYLWIGTGEGVVKFDGARISPIKIGSTNSTAFCTAIHSFKNENIVGFFDGTVAIGNRSNLKLVNGTLTGKIVDIASNENTVFISSQNQVARLSGSAIIQEISFNNTIIKSILPVGNDQLIIATQDGLYEYVLSTKQKKLISNTSFYSLINTRQGAIALGDSTIFLLDKSGLIPVYNFKSNVSLVGACLAISDNKLYLSYENKLVQFAVKTKSLSVTNEFTIGNEESTARAIALVDDQIWIGTYGSGIAYFNPSSFSYYSSKDKRIDPTVALSLQHGELRELSTNKFYVYRLNESGLPIFPAKTQINFPFKTSAGCFLTNDKILAGTEKGEVFLINSIGSAVLEKTITNVLPKKPILAINQDQQYIYISVALNGTFVFDVNYKLINHFNTENGLLHNDIFKVFTDLNKRVWFISRSSGLTYLDQNEFKYLTLREGLSSLEFTDVANTTDGKVWFSTAGGGLTSFDNGAIENYGISSGLSSDYFYGILGMNNTLYTYSRGDINILVNNTLRKIESREIGLSPNFSPRAIVSGPNCMIIGSEYGPIIQTINQVFQSNSLKILVNTMLVDDDKRYAANTNLGYQDYKLEFQVEKINLDPFFQPNLEYKLAGFDKDWQPLDQQSVIYQSIKDNDYQFIVRDKSYPKNQFQFSFSVDKPFWKKPVYYLIFGVLIILSVYTIFKIRLRQLHLRNKELEDKVVLRTKELQTKNNELEQFTFAISHDLKNPAINMVELVKMLTNLPENQPDLGKEVIKQLGTVSSKMLANLLDLIDLLKYARSEDLPTEKIDLEELINHVQDGIAPTQLDGLASLSIDLAGFKHLTFNKANLQSVFQNLISNAVKYRQPNVPAEISIKSFMKNNHPAIAVTDNGLGMDLKIHGERLFGIFQRMHHHVEGSGIGLHLVKSIMEKHGGKIEVESEVGKGTTFTLIFSRKAL